MLYFQSFLTAYCLWKSCQIRIREPNLNSEILTKSTYGTYFSCPSLEISSTSLSSRLSIAMSTASPDAILKKNTDFNYFRCPPMLALISTRGLLLCRCMQQHSETTAVSLDGRQTFSALEVRLFDISLIILVYLRLVTFSTIQS